MLEPVTTEDSSVVTKHQHKSLKKVIWRGFQFVQNMHILQLIAESRPDEKETIVKVIVNLINQNN